jgi:hypothetical protein
MANVSNTSHFNVPAEKIWELIGDFNALADWHPAVEKSELEEGGHVRRLSLVGGGTIVEKLERLDTDSFQYRYSIIDSPLPVADYVAELRVEKDEFGEGCKVHWSSEFNPSGASVADAEQVIKEIYDAGFDNLKKIFGI